MHSDHENPRASFPSVQRLKLYSLNRIDFKEPGNSGLPTRRRVMASISSDTVFTGQNLRICTEYLQNNFRNIKYDNKRTYLQQEKENYSKDCFGNERCKLAKNSVISCNKKFRIKVSRRATHQGWKWAFKYETTRQKNQPWCWLLVENVRFYFFNLYI